MSMATIRKRSRARFMEWLRHFNKYVTNPITLTFAGRKVYAVVHHTGRRSGQPYKTPVLAAAVEGGFVIPLPYGEHVDWYRNCSAASRFKLQWKGKMFTVTGLEIVDAGQALPAYGAVTQSLLRRNEVNHFLKVIIAIWPDTP